MAVFVLPSLAAKAAKYINISVSQSVNNEKLYSVMSTSTMRNYLSLKVEILKEGFEDLSSTKIKSLGIY